MAFWSLFATASMPIVQVLLISGLGAFLATDYCNLLSVDTRKSLNKLVFTVFTPSLIFASLAKTVTLEDIIAWWFMPINVGLTFLFGGLLGWMLVKILRPKRYLEGLIIATCSSGNLGNLLIIIVPAICDENGSPFGPRDICRSTGLSYASFSMAIGGFYIWTYTYQLITNSSVKLKASEAADAAIIAKEANKDLNSTPETHLLNPKPFQDSECQIIVTEDSTVDSEKKKESFPKRVADFFHQILEELLAPPTLGAIVGFIFGAITWMRKLVIGDDAPLRVIQDSVKLLGDGTIPCITLILGGNLIQGLRSSAVKPSIIIGVVCVRYMLLPVVGIGMVKLAGTLGFLPSDPLYHYVLLVQYTLPPAMNIGTMTQLHNVGQEECSVLFLWTYLVAALSLTGWSTVFMWLYS